MSTEDGIGGNGGVICGGLNNDIDKEELDQLAHECLSFIKDNFAFYRHGQLKPIVLKEIVENQELMEEGMTSFKQRYTYVDTLIGVSLKLHHRGLNSFLIACNNALVLIVAIERRLKQLLQSCVYIFKSKLSLDSFVLDHFSSFLWIF